MGYKIGQYVPSKKRRPWMRIDREGCYAGKKGTVRLSGKKLKP